MARYNVHLLGINELEKLDLHGFWEHGLYYEVKTLPDRLSVMARFRLEYIGTANWETVLKSWEKSEQGIWDDFYKGRGFDTWTAWRMDYVRRFTGGRMIHRTIDIHRIINPMELVPTMWVGSFPGWRQYLPPGKMSQQFCGLVFNDAVRQNPKIVAIRKNPPKKTMLIGFTDGECISVLEGTHRACAITLSSLEGIQLGGDVFIALIHFGKNQALAFERTYTFGSI